MRWVRSCFINKDSTYTVHARLISANEQYWSTRLIRYTSKPDLVKCKIYNCRTHTVVWRKAFFSLVSVILFRVREGVGIAYLVWGPLWAGLWRGGLRYSLSRLCPGYCPDRTCPGRRLGYIMSSSSRCRVKGEGKKREEKERGILSTLTKWPNSFRLARSGLVRSSVLSRMWGCRVPKDVQWLMPTCESPFIDEGTDLRRRSKNWDVMLMRWRHHNLTPIVTLRYFRHFCFQLRLSILLLRSVVVRPSAHSTSPAAVFTLILHRVPLWAETSADLGVTLTGALATGSIRVDTISGT